MDSTNRLPSRAIRQFLEREEAAPVYARLEWGNELKARIQQPHTSPKVVITVPRDNGRGGTYSQAYSVADGALIVIESKRPGQDKTCITDAFTRGEGQWERASDPEAALEAAGLVLNLA